MFHGIRVVCAVWFAAMLACVPAFAARPMIGSGEFHSLMLTQTGDVYAVGSNSSGQLGNGSTTNSPTAWVTSGIDGVVQVAAGTLHSLALKRDGTVWAWGGNFAGQLGDGTTTSRSTPVQVTAPGFTGIVAIAAASASSYALDSTGHVWSWGSNTNSALGDGTTTERHVPGQLSAVGGVTAIAAGVNHVMALLADGTVRAWGGNGSGQLGDGTTTTRSVPVPVPGLANVVRIAASNSNSYAVLADGTVRAWGLGGSGAVGNGGTANSFVPVTVLTAAMTPLSCAVEIAAGASYALATTCAGAVVAWGLNDYGQLGLGDATNRLYATVLPATGGISGVFINGSTFNRHSFIYLPAGPSGLGQFRAFGFNSEGPLGTGDTSNHSTPTPVLSFAPGSKLGQRTNFLGTSRADVFWRRSDGTNLIWDYTGSGPLSFTPYGLPGVETTWTAMATGDVTGDGVSDVVWFQPSNGLVAIWKMNDPATIAGVTFPASVGPGSAWQLKGVGDLDGDAYADLLWRNANTGEVVIWYMNGAGTIDQALSYGAVPLSYEVKALADVDGDWVKDIVWQQATTGQVVIWNMHPGGSFTPWFPASVGPASGWIIDRAGDFDGDGREDLFWRNANGQTAVWYMNGPTIATVQFLVGVPLADWSTLGIGDYDLDGREDILWLSNAASIVRWRMQGRFLAPVNEGVLTIGSGWQSVQ